MIFHSHEKEYSVNNKKIIMPVFPNLMSELSTFSKTNKKTTPNILVSLIMVIGKLISGYMLNILNIRKAKYLE